MKEKKNNFIIKYCRYCRGSFEVNSYGGKKYVSYYDDMPTYGLERKACPKHDHKDSKEYHEEKL